MVNFDLSKGKDMAIHNLPALFNETYNDAKAIGLQNLPDLNRLTVLYNQKIGSSWGLCFHDSLILKFNRILCSCEDPMAIKNTMMHELIHACGVRGHKWLFKSYVAKIMNHPIGKKYSISRCTSVNEKMTKDEILKKYKYVLECPSCGKTWGYQRYSKSIYYADFCECPVCHIKLKRTK